MGTKGKGGSATEEGLSAAADDVVLAVVGNADCNASTIPSTSLHALAISCPPAR